MLYTLENDNIKITTSTFGGELNNLIGKKENTEFLWSGDPTYWKYHAPILFPIVGKVREGKYTVDGKIYELSQHGLARVREFEMINKTEDSITFQLNSSEDTLKVYPYNFSLRITYKLVEAGVNVIYSVENTDNKTINFSIGAHPAFMCPIEKDETLEDYYFQLDKEETSEILLLDTSLGLFNGEREAYFDNSNIIPLAKDTFKNDALVFDDLKSTKVTLKSKNHNKSLSMDFTGFPFMAFWAPPTGAPFICIEPWYGHADSVDFTGDFKDKAGIETLKVGETFECNYILSVTE